MTDLTRTELVCQRLGLVLRRRGRRGWCLCPFHDDHDPSFMVRVDGERVGQFFCFVCKEGGGLIDLVMKLRGYQTATAAREFIGEGEDAPPPPATSVRVELLPQPGRRRFVLPEEVILEPLRDWVTPARRYAEGRGLTDWQVTRHGVGYAVDGRLAGRIVFPVTRFGEHVNYTARTFVDAMPRYLNARADEDPDLDALWGEDAWAPVVRRDSIVYVTEGALDALAVERTIVAEGLGQRGNREVTALNGSHVRPLHVARLATFGAVVVMTDADLAGDEAYEELRAGLCRHTVVRRVRLPAGTDANGLPADELARHLFAAPAPAEDAP